MKTRLIVIIAIIFLAVIVFGAANMIRERSALPTTEAPGTNEQVFCTMDAMMCPDGSYVGRVPPSCNFAACPIP